MRLTMRFIVSLLLLGNAGWADDPRTRDYSAIDQWALEMPQSEWVSPERVAAYLVRPAKDDFDKTRALFRWLAANIRYDVEAFLSGDMSHTGAGDTFSSGKSVCEGYSNLFEQMGKAVGLEVVTIEGWGKGYGYTPGEGIGQANHAWNAVRVGEEWYLLDSTWGAGHVNEAAQYVSRFEDFYFLTPPEQFVYSHLPRDPKWQLLDQPVAAEAFLAAVRPEPAFFRYGVRLRTHGQAVVAGGRELRIAFAVPEGAFLLVNVTRGGQSLTERPLEGQRDPEGLVFDLTFPGPGSYEAHFYGNPKDQYGMYDAVVKYRVQVTP